MRKIVVNLVYTLIIILLAVNALTGEPLGSAANASAIFLLIESIVLFIGLSILMRYGVRRTLGKNKNNENSDDDSQKTESEFIYRKLFIAAIALIPLVFNLPVLFSISDKTFIKSSHIAGIGLLFLAFFFLIKFTQQLIILKRKEHVSLSEVVFRYMGYYNSDDKRTFVEKQIGVGTTVNFATKGGKLFGIFMILIPLLTIFVILIVVLMH